MGFLLVIQWSLRACRSTLLDSCMGMMIDIKIGESVECNGHECRSHQLLELVSCRDYVKTMIQKASDLAPLHNPANMQGIEAAEKTFTHAVQVAVFDTAFHQTMPPQAYTYPLPKDVCNRYGIRKYGFHGTSYKYLTRKTAEFLGKDEDSLNAIICHLGAGASMCAVQQGKSRDTTMGLTPLQGLMMGTRCGMTHFWM